MNESRLDQLERRVRRLTVALGIACSCAVGLLLMGTRSASLPPGPVRATSFELVDAAGRVIGEWKPVEGNGTMLALWARGDSATAARIQLLAADRSGKMASVRLSTHDGVEARIGVDAGRDASFAASVSRRPRVSLSSGSSTHPRGYGKLLLLQDVPGPERTRVIGSLPE